MNNNNDVLLRVSSVLEIVPVSKATWYRIIGKHKELTPIKIGRSSFWKKSVIIEHFIDNHTCEQPNK